MEPGSIDGFDSTISGPVLVSAAGSAAHQPGGTCAGHQLRRGTEAGDDGSTPTSTRTNRGTDKGKRADSGATETGE